jgi:hypothetical protein
LQESDVEAVVNKIFDKWNETHAAPKKPIETKQEEVDIAELMKTQTLLANQASSHRYKVLTEEEKRIKEQILASYSQTSDKEDDEEDSSGEYDDDPDFEKNTNKSDVQKLQKEKREQQKKDSEEKKLKDKEDRAKQKARRKEG